MRPFDLSFKRRPETLPYRAGVGIIALNQQGQVLIGLHRDIWQMPQGGIDLGEKPSQAAVRELYEETGITKIKNLIASPTTYFYDYPLQDTEMTEDARIYKLGARGQSFIWHKLDVIDPTEIDPNRFSQIEKFGPEFDQIRWAHPEEVVSLAHEDNSGDAVTFQRQQMYIAVFKEFGLLPKEYRLVSDIVPRRKRGKIRELGRNTP